MDGLTYLKMNNSAKTAPSISFLHINLFLNLLIPMSHLQSQSCYVMGYWTYQGCKNFNERESEREIYKGEKYLNILKRFKHLKMGINSPS